MTCTPKTDTSGRTHADLSEPTDDKLKAELLRVRFFRFIRTIVTREGSPP